MVSPDPVMAAANELLREYKSGPVGDYILRVETRSWSLMQRAQRGENYVQIVGRQDPKYSKLDVCVKMTLRGKPPKDITALLKGDVTVDGQHVRVVYNIVQHGTTGLLYDEIEEDPFQRQYHM